VAGGAVLAALIVWAVHELSRTSFDWGLLATSVRHMAWGWLVLCLVPIAGTYYGRALRWAVFLRPLKAQPSMRNLMSATVIGFAAITLFGRPGELVRPYLIAVKEGVPWPSQAAAWLLERIFDLLMVLMIFGFALMRLNNTAVHVGPRLAWVLMTGGRFVAITAVVVFLLLLSMRNFAKPFHISLMKRLRFLSEKKYQRIDNLVRTFVQGVESTRSTGALLAVFGYSVLEWALIVACFWCLTKAFDASLHFTLSDVLILLGFVSFGAIVQIPGIGGGMQVVTVLVLTELFRIKLEVASSFALVTWALTFVAIAPVGIVLALKEGLDWRGLHKIGREAP
jgi:uncharacterized protein (TIRG00374 family)